jgi:phenylacetate-CoA ligase
MAIPEVSRLSFVRGIDELLVGRISFPAVNHVLNRKDILGRYRKLLASELYSKDALRELKFQKLLATLRHVSIWNPFYARRFKEIGLVPEDVRSLEDLRRIPILARQDVIDHRLEMVDIRYRDSVLSADRARQKPGLPVLFGNLRERKLVRNTSTGSTGTPTVFYDNGSTTSLNWAHELRLKHWFGLAPGAKEARMTGISTLYSAKSMRRSARKFFWNQMILPGIFLSDREYEFSAQKLREFKPRVLWGLTSALTGLARYMQRVNKGIAPCSPELVISWAAPLYEHEKNLLADVFGCSVTNLYGTREVGHLAMQCPHGSMHVNDENYILELEGMGIGEEKAGPGSILVTQLNASPMPFLRYRIGDLAEIAENVCSCGRSLSVLKSILGRTGDVFKTKDGRLIEPGFWCHAFMVGRQSQDVEKFQVVYRRNDRILFRVIPKASYSGQTEAELRSLMEKHFQSGIQFDFEYVSDIKPQPSGKCPIVVNEIEPQEEGVAELQSS